jgi:hypothetical protein
MANQDVRDAAETLNGAVQALDTSALLEASFTKEKYTSYVAGLRDHFGREVERVKILSAELVEQLDAIKTLE